MEGPRYHLDVARHPGPLEASGVVEALIMEQIEGADAHPGRRQPGQVRATGRNRDIRVGTTEIG